MSSSSITSLFRSWDWSLGLIVEFRLLDVLDTDFLFGGGVWGGVVMVGEDEVLGNEFELELVVESANDLDLSRFAFCRNFGSLDDECEVDGAGEEFDGEWRGLLECIVLGSDYAPTRPDSSLSSVSVQSDRGVYLRPQSLQMPTPTPSPSISWELQRLDVPGGRNWPWVKLI